MIFLTESDIHDEELEIEEVEDVEEVEGESLDLEPSVEAGLVLDGMSKNMFHVITEAVLISDAKEYALRARAQLYEQTGRSSEAMNLVEKAEALQEASIKDMWKKIKDVFVKMWKWIKGLFQDFIAWISKFLSGSEKYANKYGDMFIKQIDGKDNKWSFRGYKFPGLAKMSGVENALKGLSATINAFNKNTSGYNPDKYMSTSTIKDVINGDVGEIRADIVGRSGSISAEDFRKELKIAIYGSEDKQVLYKGYFSSVKNSIVDDMKKGKKPVDNIKKLQRSVDNEYKRIIKGIENAQAVFAREDNPTNKKANAEATRAIAKIREIMSVTNTSCAAYMGAWKRYMNQCKAVISHTISHRRVSESTDSGSILDDLMGLIS